MCNDSKQDGIKSTKQFCCEWETSGPLWTAQKKKKKKKNLNLISVLQYPIAEAGGGKWQNSNAKQFYSQTSSNCYSPEKW